VFQPRGKVLGGSSSINGLLYVRGQHEDYDRWRQRGNAGWGYDDVLPYFKKAENQQRGADEYHGAAGRCRCPIGAMPIRCRKPSSPPRRDRHSRQSRFQRRDAGRRRLFPDHDAARPARQHGVLLSAPGAAAAICASRPIALAQRILFEGRRAKAVEYKQQGRRCARAGAQGNPGVERRL
jgi:choline dehydrogenase